MPARPPLRHSFRPGRCRRRHSCRRLRRSRSYHPLRSYPRSRLCLPTLPRRSCRPRRYRPCRPWCYYRRCWFHPSHSIHRSMRRPSLHRQPPRRQVPRWSSRRKSRLFRCRPVLPTSSRRLPHSLRPRPRPASSRLRRLPCRSCRTPSRASRQGEARSARGSAGWKCVGSLEGLLASLRGKRSINVGWCVVAWTGCAQARHATTWRAAGSPR
jgi:hypothetical protein